MRFPSGRRFWALYVVTVGVLSALAYVVAYWATGERPPSELTRGSGRAAVETGEVEPSPPVYDTVSPLKQDR